MRTPQERRLELSRAINRLSAAILADETTPGVLQSLVNIAGPVLDVDRAAIYDVRLGARLAVGLCEWLHEDRDITPTKADYPLELFASAAEELARTGAPLQSSREAVHPLLVRDGAGGLLHGEMRIRRLLWFPFQRRQDGFYLLVFNRVTEDRPWNADELEFVDAVSHQVSLALMKLDLLSERVRNDADLRRNEADLRRSEARLQALYDHAPSMFFTVDRARTVRNVNRFAIEHLGYARDELVGKDVLGVVHPEDRAAVVDHLAACFANPGAVRTQAFRKIRGNGSIIWVREVVRVVDNPDGQHALIVCDDVTESRAHEEAARNAESKAHDRDEFMAVLGHELRNPLAPIVTALDILRRRGRNDRELEVIDRQIAHVRRLVDDLLDVSRITRGKVELRLERVEVAVVAAQAVEVARPLFEEKHQVLDVTVPPSGLAVQGDAARLVQVFSNLLTNAAKYSKPGTRTCFTAKRQNDRVVVQVRDEGEGIEPEMLERVFGPFVQRAQPPDRAQSGLGLGLTIVRNLITLHGGTVRAASGGRGKGTTLVVDLPAATGEPTRPASATAGPSDHAIDEASRGTVLVVDDNEDAREMLCDALALLGYPVHGAGDGPSALSAADTFKPDVALVDIGLPGMDGYELARRLRHAHGDALQLVAVTGYGQQSDRVRSRKAGFDMHVVKPVELATLRGLLHRVESRANPVS